MINEKTPLLTRPPKRRGAGEVEGARESLTTFGDPTVAEKARYKAKQFKSLLQTVSCCTIIAVLLTVVIIASHNNFSRPPVPAGLNTTNASTIPANGSIVIDVPAVEQAGRPRVLLLRASGINVRRVNPPVWNVTKEDVAKAIEVGKAAQQRLKLYMESVPAVHPDDLDQSQLTPNDLYRAAKVGFFPFKPPNYLGYAIEAASAHIAKSFGLSRANLTSAFWESLPEIPWGPQCPFLEQETCSAGEKYRRINGTCNNLVNSRWGAAGQPYMRLIDPVYNDGVSTPRMFGKDGSPLPSARTVSQVVHTAELHEETGVTMMLMLWGQFIDHDIVASDNLPGAIDCCNKSAVQIGNSSTHPECFPIEISKDDPFYGPRNITCMNVVRDGVAPTMRLGPRQQMNKNTAFIDGSVIYGSSEEELQSLRKFENGALITTRLEDGREVLPLRSSEHCSLSVVPSETPRCPFKSGDSRAEENLALTSMHTIWVREHNRIAAKLSEINPSWDDEKLFQEARRIVIAEMQHITYYEYLPALMGQNWDSEFVEHLGKNVSAYKPDVDPTITNVFAGAAYRFGHSMIQGLIRFNIEGKLAFFEENVPLHELQFNASRMYGSGQMDGLLRGYTDESCRQADRFFSSQLTNHLFETINSNYGLDLVALNIQRGRDRGLGTFNDWRDYCGHPRFSSFDELTEVFDNKSIAKFKSVYKSVDDIDAYSAFVTEKHTNGRLIGRTLVCLVGEQFYRLKYGDRFWYEFNSSPHPFEPDQLAEIKKTTLARVICDNADNMKMMRPKPMLRYDRETNDRVFCQSFPKLQLTAWEEFSITLPAGNKNRL